MARRIKGTRLMGARSAMLARRDPTGEEAVSERVHGPGQREIAS